METTLGTLLKTISEILVLVQMSSHALGDLDAPSEHPQVINVD